MLDYTMFGFESRIELRLWNIDQYVHIKSTNSNKISLSIKVKDLSQSAITSKCTNVVLNIHEENQTYGKSVGVSPKLNIVNVLKIISYGILWVFELWEHLQHLCGEKNKNYASFRPQKYFQLVSPCGFQQLDRVGGCGTIVPTTSTAKLSNQESGT